MSLVEEVGARLILQGRAEFVSGLKGAAAAQKEFGDAGAAAGKASAAGMGAASSAAKQAAKDAQAAADAHTKALGQIKTALDGVAKASAAGIVVAGAMSVKWASQYQTALTQLQTMAHITPQITAQLGKSFLQMAPGLGTNPTALVQAAYHPLSAGLSPALAKQVVAASAKEALMSGANLDDTTYSLSSVMKLYGSKNALGTQAMLNAIVGQGDMRFQDLNAAISTGFLTTGQTFGMSLAQQGAMLDYFTDRGMPAQQAATRIRMSEALVGAPSGKATKLLTSLGMSSSDATASTAAMTQLLQLAGLTTTTLSTDLRKGGMVQAINDLRNHLKASGLDPAGQAALVSDAFGGGRSGTLIQALVANGTSGLVQKQQGLQAASTPQEFNAAWATYTKTTSYQLKQLDAQVHTMGIEWGQKLLPYVNTGVRDLASGLNWAKSNAGALETAAEVLGTIWAGWKLASITKDVMDFSTALFNYRGNLTGAATETDTAATMMTTGMNRAKIGVGLGVAGIVGVIGGYEASSHGSVKGTLLAAAGAAAAGFTVAGPWGAVVGGGAAGFGAIAGRVKGWLLDIDTAASKTRTAVDGLATSIQNAYSANGFKMSTAVQNAVFGFVSNPQANDPQSKTLLGGLSDQQAINTLSGAGLTVAGLMQDFESPTGWYNALTPEQKAKLGIAGMTLVQNLAGAFVKAIADAAPQAKLYGITPDITAYGSSAGSPDGGVVTQPSKGKKVSGTVTLGGNGNVVKTPSGLLSIAGLAATATGAESSKIEVHVHGNVYGNDKALISGVRNGVMQANARR